MDTIEQLTQAGKRKIEEAEEAKRREEEERVRAREEMERQALAELRAFVSVKVAPVLVPYTFIRGLANYTIEIEGYAPIELGVRYKESGVTWMDSRHFKIAQPTVSGGKLFWRHDHSAWLDTHDVGVVLALASDAYERALHTYAHLITHEDTSAQEQAAPVHA